MSSGDARDHRVDLPGVPALRGVRVVRERGDAAAVLARRLAAALQRGTTAADCLLAGYKPHL